MPFLGGKALAETARRNPTEKKATIGEIADLAWQGQWELNSSVGAGEAINDEYEAWAEEIRQTTGDSSFLSPHHPRSPENEKFGGISSGPAGKRREDMFQQRLAQVLEQFPDLPTRTSDSIRQKIADDRGVLRQEIADVEARTNVAFFACGRYFLIID